MTIERDPYGIVYDGVTYYTEREVTRVDDWRDTSFGPVNFGFVRFGPPRWQPRHPMLAVAETNDAGKWWQFWCPR